jgi:hypothetical protein
MTDKKYVLGDLTQEDLAEYEAAQKNQGLMKRTKRRLLLTDERKDQWLRVSAAKTGLSINAFLNRIIEDRMQAGKQKK